MISLLTGFLTGIFCSLVIFYFESDEHYTIEHTIKKDNYYFRLKSMKLFLDVHLRILNKYLGTEGITDETELVNEIPKIEYQIEQINYLLTDYGKVKELK